MSGTSKSIDVDEGRLAAITTGPMPASRKVYLPGTMYPFLRVPVREIAQTPTRRRDATGAEGSETPNPPISVYDTSGPYTDADAKVDLRKGLAPLRVEWIRSREDTGELGTTSSAYGRVRRADARLHGQKFFLDQKPRVAKSGSNVTQLHYARRGIVTPEMEFVAIRENQRVVKELAFEHPGASWGASIPRVITPEFVRDEVARGRA